jgi:SAM-dependent methyltransferase
MDGGRIDFVDRADAASQSSPQAVSSIAAIPLRERVLDVCCGSRMFWFDRQHPDALFVDNRAEAHSLPDKSSRGGSRELVVDPDLVADFTALPFEDGSFALVAFDPPHLVRNGRSGWLAKKYGKLDADWRDDLRKGFAECFRVLRPDGVLVFKWNEHEIPVSAVLALTPEQPLFGNRCGKSAKSHWLVFMKPREA